MFDASRLTLETDEQTKVINELIKIYKDSGENNINPKEKLKDFVGHTHIQMLVGFCLGITVTLIYFCL